MNNKKVQEKMKKKKRGEIQECKKKICDRAKKRDIIENIIENIKI